MRMLPVILFLLALATNAGAATWQTVVAKIQAGQAVKIVVLGNSIGCGISANTDAGSAWNSATMMNQSGPTKNKLVGITSDGSPNSSFGPHIPVNGWVNQLYGYLLGLNAASVVINESGAGWNTADHLGLASSIPSGENTVAKIVAYPVRPDLVIVPLQINDWAQSKGLSFFNTYFSNILDNLTAGGLTVVVGIESPVFNGSSATSYPDNYNTDTVNESGAKNFYTSAIALANARGLPMIDLFTAIDTLAKAQSGSDYGTKLWNTGLFFDGSGTPHTPIHPNQAGHNLMATAAIGWFQQTVTEASVSAGYKETIRGSFR